jgi:hypothetical protein
VQGFAEPDREHDMGMIWDMKGTAAMVLYMTAWYMADYNREHWYKGVRQTVLAEEVQISACAELGPMA